MTRLEALLGLLVAVALLGLLPLGLSNDGETMALAIDGPGPYRLPGAAPPRATTVDRAEEWRERLAPGLVLHGWTVEYGKRWRREVVVPELDGAVAPEGTPWCGFEVRVPPAALDPGRGAPGLARQVERELGRLFPMTLPCGLVTDVTLPPLESVEVAMVPGDGVLAVGVVGRLRDGTEVGAHADFVALDHGGRLHIERRGSVTPIFDGPGRARCEGTVSVRAVDLWRRLVQGKRESIIATVARGEITRRMAPVIEELNRSLGALHQPFPLFTGRTDTARLVLGGAPRVDRRGLVLPVCAVASLGEPRVDRAIVGPARGRTELPPMTELPDEPHVEVAVSEAGADALLYVLWRPVSSGGSAPRPSCSTSCPRR
jgi:hypothetical protein